MRRPQKILLLPMCGLGDAVWYLPFVCELRAHFPDAEIVAVVVSGAAASILQTGAANIEVIVFDRGDQQRGWGPLLRLLWSLRRRRFDVVISGAHPDSVRIPLFAFLCGPKVRVGAQSERLSFLYTHRVDVRGDAHYFDRYRLLLTGVGIFMPRERYCPILEPPPEARESATRIWAEAGLAGSELVVGLASGADVNSRGKWQPYMKRWSSDGYAAIARQVTEKQGARVVMFGGAVEAGLVKDIAEISGVPVVNLCGKTGLGELQWLIRMCHVFVSNDTGIMHMAGALGAPVVSLFGPTSSTSFSPPGERQHIIQGHAPCSPCYPHPTCDLKRCRAMDDISLSQVIHLVSSLMKSAEAARVLQESVLK